MDSTSCHHHHLPWAASSKTQPDTRAEFLGWSERVGSPGLSPTGPVSFLTFEKYPKSCDRAGRDGSPCCRTVWLDADTRARPLCARTGTRCAPRR